MNIAASTISHLRDTAAVCEYVGKRIYRTVVPDSDDLPYVTVQRIGGTRHEHYQDGVSGMRGSRLQINCYAGNPNTADEISEAVRIAMDGMEHTTVGAPPFDQSVGSVSLDDDFDDYEEPVGGGDKGTYSVRQEWHVWHDESVPVRV